MGFARTSALGAAGIFSLKKWGHECGCGCWVAGKMCGSMRTTLGVLSTQEIVKGTCFPSRSLLGADRFLCPE